MATEIDGRRMLADARELAFPRYPGTTGDRRAIEMVARRFRDAGLEVVEEEFSYDIRFAFRTIRFMLVGSALLVAAAGLVAVKSSALAAILLAAAVVTGGTLVVWAPGMERLYSRPGPTSTSNVTGYRRVPHSRLRLIFMAHHDSKSQNLTLPTRTGLTFLALIGAGGLTLVLILGWLADTTVAPAWSAPVLGSTTALALLVLSTIRSGNDSPGGVDNAGSVGIVCELARVLPTEVAEDVELIFLSTGAEEDHMVGAMRWLNKNLPTFDRRAAYALNLDGAGAPGRTVLIERYGLGKPFSRTMSRVARESARVLGDRFRSITMLPAMGVDAIPFAHRGLKCLTLSSGSLDRATMSVHSANDVAGHLDRHALERVAKLARAMTLRLARG